jgi:predicted nucleic acid-binding protein
VTVYFFDSSAIVKRYVAEIGSNWILQLSAPNAKNTIFLARITWVEILSALSRRQREGSIDAATVAQIVAVLQTHFAKQYRVLEVDRTLTDMAGDLVRQHPLRAYDALQLAAALRLKNALNQAQLLDPVFLTADQRLLAIAQAVRLPGDDPNQYP